MVTRNLKSETVHLRVDANLALFIKQEAKRLDLSIGEYTRQWNLFLRLQRKNRKSFLATVSQDMKRTKKVISALARDPAFQEWHKSKYGKSYNPSDT